MLLRRRAHRLSVAVASALVLGATVLAAAATAFDTFASAGSLVLSRGNHTATLLPNGKIFFAGGFGASGELAETELYDPVTGLNSPSGLLTEGGEGTSATLLPSGKVLVVGGTGKSGAQSTADLYDPASDLISSTGDLNQARYGQTATLLRNGKVLIAGGSGSGGARSSAEIYDPASGTFSTTGSMLKPRYGHTAALLPNGKVLIAGGYGMGDGPSSAELYDPVSGTFSATGSMAEGRADATATLLPSGKVLIAGGFAGSGSRPSAELYDPATGGFSAGGTMSQGRYSHTATLIRSGKVLIAGGIGSDGALSSVELYDPVSSTFSSTGSLTDGRYQHTATVLPGGKVLVTGGFSGHRALSSAEIYDPNPIVSGFPGHESGNGLDFGETVGGSSTPTVKVYFANLTQLFGADGALSEVNGDLGALGLNVIGISNESTSPFYVTANGCDGASLVPGSRCSFRVKFDPFPWQRGEFTRELMVQDSTGWHALTLSGVALETPKFLIYKPVARLAAGQASFSWYMTDSAKITISITQPVKATVRVRKGRKTVKKVVTTIKPVVIKTILKQEAGAVGQGGSVISWNTKIAGKPAAKGNWTVSIKAQSRRGAMTVTAPLKLR